MSAAIAMPGANGRTNIRWRPMTATGLCSSSSAGAAPARREPAPSGCASSSAGWEVLQFTGADLGADGVWTLTALLRGQMGTELAASAGAAAGARAVLLTPAVEQPAFALDLRGLALDWTAGPADDPTSRRPSVQEASPGRRAV